MVKVEFARVYLHELNVKFAPWRYCENLEIKMWQLWSNDRSPTKQDRELKLVMPLNFSLVPVKYGTCCYSLLVSDFWLGSYYNSQEQKDKYRQVSSDINQVLDPPKKNLEKEKSVKTLRNQLKSGSHFPKKVIYLLQWLPFKNDEKCILLQAFLILKIFKLLSWLFG